MGAGLTGRGPTGGGVGQAARYTRPARVTRRCSRPGPWQTDVPRLLPGALVAGLLLRGEVLAVRFQRSRIGQQFFVPVSTCNCHRQVTGSAPPWLRRKATRLPSGATLNERGTPRENRLVRACWRGKLSVMAPILPAGDQQEQPGPATGGGRLRLARRHPPDPGVGCSVHAHPDDESIETGATMARYAAAGVPVTLVTCTLGELGEIIPADLAYLSGERGELLGKYRIGELAVACAALGVPRSPVPRRPGPLARLRHDGPAQQRRPRCFWRADLDEATLDLVAIIREVRPRVMVELRRPRVLRASRPHPGAPGGLARLPVGR